jgi:cytosine/uracil/thiamine/allantoin permease
VILAWVLVLVSCKVSLFELFSVVGALVAPVVGVLAADYVRSKGRWDGPRPGVNWQGVLAWAIGVAVGLAPPICDAVVHTSFRFRQPAVLLAFFASACAYTLLAGLVREAPTLPGLSPPPKEPDPAA